MRELAGSAKELDELVHDCPGGLLRKIVAALERAPRHRRAAIRAPNRQRVVPGFDLCLAAPQHQQRTFDFPAGGAARAIVLEVDRSCGAALSRVSGKGCGCASQNQW